MRSLFTAIALTLVASLAFAAGIDGKWKFEVKMPEGKGKRAGQMVATTLDLKSEGAKLTGTTSTDAGRRAADAEIQDGKIEGNRISFTTMQKTRKGETKLVWKATLEGEELKGSRSLENGKRAQEFTAKRQ